MYEIHFEFNTVKGFNESTFKSLLIQELERDNIAHVLNIEECRNGYKVDITSEYDIKLSLAVFESIHIDYPYIERAGIPNINIKEA